MRAIIAARQGANEGMLGALQVLQHSMDVIMGK